MIVGDVAAPTYARRANDLEQEAYIAARRRLLAPPRSIPDELIREAQDVGTRALTRGRYPAHYSPSGLWNRQAVEDAVGNWMTYRLLERGQLARMALETLKIEKFRAKLKTSLRQDLIDRLERSESSNLYQRIRRILENQEQFSCANPSAPVRDRVWSIEGVAERFIGDDRRLVSAAYAAGSFPRVCYRSDAGKLSPVLEAPDLESFLAALLGHGTMTLAEMAVAINGRYNLHTRTDVALEDEYASPGHLSDALLGDEAAEAMRYELTSRQLAVLRLSSDGHGVRDIAKSLDCSVGTVSAERRAISECCARLGVEDAEVLNKVIDRAFNDANDDEQNVMGS